MNIFQYIYNEMSEPGALSDKSADRLYDIIKNRIQRKFGVKVYAQKWRIPIKSSHGTIHGVMMMLGDGEHAFRLNYGSASGGAVESIDFWLHPSSNPQLHVSTAGLNIVQMVAVIEEVLDKKKVGTILIDESGDVQDENNEEVSLNEARGERSTGERVRRKRTRDNITIDEEPEETESKRGKRRKVKVEKVDFDELVVVKDEFYDLFDVPLNDDELFSLLEFEVRKVKNKTNRALLILGDPGVGKSYTVIKELAGENSITFKGTITGPAALYKVLFMNNDPDKIIIFDDLDTLFDNDKSANILKGALDSAAVTEVSYLSKNNVNPLFYDVLVGNEQLTPDVLQKLEAMKINTNIFDSDQGHTSKMLNKLKARALNADNPNAILPNKFDFKARVIFISNRYLQDFPSSLISRSAVIEVSLTLEQIVARIEKVLPNLELDGRKVDMAVKKEALKFLKDVVVPSKRIKKIDFRGFGDIIKYAMTPDAPKEIWYRWAAVSLKNKYGEATKEEMKERRKR